MIGRSSRRKDPFIVRLTAMVMVVVFGGICPRGVTAEPLSPGVLSTRHALGRIVKCVHGLPSQPHFGYTPSPYPTAPLTHTSATILTLEFQGATAPSSCVVPRSPFIPETFDPTRPLLPRGAEAPRILIALMVPTCSLLPEALEIVQVTVSREHLLYCALQCLLVLPGKWVRNQPEARDRSRARHTMTRTERHCAFCIATVLLSCTTVVMPLGTEYRALCSSRKLGANATPPLMKLVLSISMQGPGSDPHGFHPNRQRAR